MGMFDVIKVEQNVSLPEYKSTYDRDKFQTKDMRGGPQGAIYIITDKGRLFEEEYEYTEGSLGQKLDIMGTMDIPLINAKLVGTKDINYHGEFNFYTIIAGGEEQEDEWIEFSAKFTDGNLVNIAIISKHIIPKPKRIITKDKRIITP